MQKVKTTIDWEAQGVLSQIADGINKPLTRIVQLIQHIQQKRNMSDFETKQLSSIMLESSEQIEALIEDIVNAEQNKKIEILVKDKFKYPDLFTFDELNLNQTNNLTQQINERQVSRISKADLEWLIQLETTIINHIDFYGLCVPTDFSKDRKIYRTDAQQVYP